MRKVFWATAGPYGGLLFLCMPPLSPWFPCQGSNRASRSGREPLCTRSVPSGTCCLISFFSHANTLADHSHFDGSAAQPDAGNLGPVSASTM
jgi:hypothetical protein